MAKARSARVVLIIAFVAMTAFGCASSGVTPMAAQNVPSLAGTWNGWVSLPTGGSTPGTFELSPGGEYVTRAGAFSARGTAQIKDGVVVLVSSGGSGRLGVTERTSTASLGQRADGMLVLKGTGRSDAGPFDFEFTRPK